MSAIRHLNAAILALGVTAGGAAAQSAVPAEFPPADFTGNQYVDSNGCAFIRAGIGGATDWIARMSRSREPLCNFQPSFPAGTAGPAPGRVAPLDAPIINITPPAAVAAAPAPAQTRSATAPIQTVASLPARRPAPAVAPAPVVSPQVIAPPAAPEPPRVTLAQACEGRFGIQPGFVSARTGNPIDCGPAPVAQVASAPAPVTPAAPEPRRMTMAQICAEVAASGTRFVRPDGSPITCAAPAPVAVAAAPAPAPVPAPTPAPAPRAVMASAPAPQVLPGYEKVWTDGRINPQRGQVAQAGSRVSTRTTAPASTTAAVMTHRYVQVGTFGVPANAARMIERLGGMGYPVASAKSGHLKVIAAGPFNTPAELASALQSVRGMGFVDAYTRN